MAFWALVPPGLAGSAATEWKVFTGMAGEVGPSVCLLPRLVMGLVVLPHLGTMNVWEQPAFLFGLASLLPFVAGVPSSV